MDSMHLFNLLCNAAVGRSSSHSPLDGDRHTESSLTRHFAARSTMDDDAPEPESTAKGVRRTDCLQKFTGAHTNKLQLTNVVYAVKNYRFECKTL